MYIFNLNCFAVGFLFPVSESLQQELGSGPKSPIVPGHITPLCHSLFPPLSYLYASVACKPLWEQQKMILLDDLNLTDEITEGRLSSLLQKVH